MNKYALALLALSLLAACKHPQSPDYDSTRARADQSQHELDSQQPPADK